MEKIIKPKLKSNKKGKKVWETKTQGYSKIVPRNKVKTNRFEYEEEVKEFTGLVFHCPVCDEIFHLHIATVKAQPAEVRVR